MQTDEMTWEIKYNPYLKYIAASTVTGWKPQGRGTQVLATAHKSILLCVIAPGPYLSVRTDRTLFEVECGD